MRCAAWLLVALAVVALMSAGCSRAFRSPPPAPSSSGAVAVQDAPVSEELAAARAALAAAQARVAAAEHRLEAERMESHRRWLSWAMGIALAAALICGALAMIVPVGRKKLATAALACVGAVIIAYLLGQVLSWLPVLAAALALASLAAVAWHLWGIARAAMRTVEVTADRGDPYHWPALKRHMKAVQGPLQPEMDVLAEGVRAADRRAAEKRQQKQQGDSDDS